MKTVFVPSRGFLFFYKDYVKWELLEISVFVPSRGFLFFYHTQAIITRFEILFSSPHGDFSFSMVKGYYVPYGYMGFRPLTGISLFL